METISIALPTTLKGYVQAQVIEGGYDSISEYLQELIEADQRRKAERHLEALLLEGLDFGPPRPLTADDWEAKRRRLTE